MRALSVFLRTALPFFTAVIGLPDDPTEPDTVVRVGPGVTPPKITYRAEPVYSPEALRAGVQGKVIFEVVANVTGRLTNITLLSPLGFGLDERAEEAIEKWRLEPGLKDGKPVNVLATVEVNFRLSGRNFNSTAEDYRERFNVALAGLKGNDEQRRNQAVKTLQDLVKHDFPPAQYVLGKLLETGEFIGRDTERGEVLVRKAADKHHGPALFDLGSAYCEGKGVAKDTEKGMRMINDAA